MALNEPIQSVKQRYRTEDGAICIDVRIKNALQLFDSRDPAPFRERDLDDDFVEYVLASAQSFSSRSKFKIVIHLTEPRENADADKIGDLKMAIRSFFAYEALLQKMHLKRQMKNTHGFLAVGLVLLLLCLVGAELASHAPLPFVKSVVREGLLIGGWVALWRPLDSLLYDWWPLSAKIRYYKNLAVSQVDFR